MPEVTHRMIDTHGVRLHIAEQGVGPLVVLLHGFPESWYSWRHQLRALADAGYHAVAPDLRGFGDSERPYPVEAYDQVELAADVSGLISALGESRAVVVGHDWGSPVAWHTSLLYPAQVRAVVGMSVPYGGRGRAAPLARIQETFKGMFFYMLYFQQQGVAEAELERDVRTSLRKFYLSASGDMRAGGAFTAQPPSARVLDTMLDDGRVPSFLSNEDLDYFTAQYEKSGFRGPLNLYRNFDRTWERTAALQDLKISQPALFIAGSLDSVIALSAKALERMPKHVPLLRDRVIFEGCGHWVQQERPEETNRALLEFLAELPA